MKQISDRLYVGPQLTAEDIRQAKSRDFAAIVNNRPDGEEPGQPSAAENRSVAEDAQLAYTHIPVTAGQFGETQVRAFQEALSQANGPVLAHCKTGTRSAMLYAIGEVLDGRMSKDQVIPFGQSAGLDLSGAVKWLDAHDRWSTDLSCKELCNEHDQASREGILRPAHLLHPVCRRGYGNPEVRDHRSGS